MSTSTFFVSQAAVRNLKEIAQRSVSQMLAGGVSSAHLSEALAAALGFRTHAALRAALANGSTAEAQKPSNAQFLGRLRDLGYLSVRDDVNLLPDLNSSQVLGRKFPLSKKRGVRWRAWRNVMVTAVNAGLEQRIFGLSPDEDWWPGATPGGNGGGHGLYRFTVDGNIPAAATVSAISRGELSIHVLVEPLSAEVEPNRSGGIEDAAAFAHGWLERRLGAWIMDGGEDFECRRVIQARLADIQIESSGYADRGGSSSRSLSCGTSRPPVRHHRSSYSCSVLSSGAWR